MRVIAICGTGFLLACATPDPHRSIVLKCTADHPSITSGSRFWIHMDETNQRLSFNGYASIPALITDAEAVFPMDKGNGRVVVDRVSQRFTMDVNEPGTLPRVPEVRGKCEPGRW